MIRFILIPIFVISFMKELFLRAALIFFVAGITDVLDGIIARKLKCESDLGKIIDPLADKLMQISAVVCLTFRDRALVWLLFLLCIKEICMIIGGLILIRGKKYVMKSKWYGKLTTAIIFVFLSLLIWLGRAPNGLIPTWVCFSVCGILAVMMLYSFIRYYIEGFRPMYAKNTLNNAEDEENKNNALQ